MAINHENKISSKCLIGENTESMCVALAMPKVGVSNIAITPAAPEVKSTGFSPFSRHYITLEDKIIWNYYLNLFGPKQLQNFDQYLKPLSLYIKFDSKVIVLGDIKVQKNIDALLQKKIFPYGSKTWDLYQKIKETDIDLELVSIVSEVAHDQFHSNKTFIEHYRKWQKKPSDLAVFFSSWVEDWLNFFKTDIGLKFWRHVPALYQQAIAAKPDKDNVARFVFKLIQPHYFFNQTHFNQNVQEYLAQNESHVYHKGFKNLVAENDQILYLNQLNEQPIRKEQYWDFPSFNFVPQKNDQVFWSWQNKQSIKYAEQNPKVIFDLEDFMIDGHYFTGLFFLEHKNQELLFAQKFQQFFDKQLEVKLISALKDKLQEDHFWNTWSKEISFSQMQGPQIQCYFFNHESSNLKNLVKWDISIENLRLSNFKTVNFVSLDFSYWSVYLRKLTKLLWSEIYQSKF